MPEYLSIAAIEGLPVPTSSDACGICIRGITSLAYNNAAQPVNIGTLENAVIARENDLMKLQGSLGALRVSPTDCSQIALHGAHDGFSGHELKSMSLAQTSFVGFFHHHDIRFVLTPKVRVVADYPFSIEEREVPTAISFTQFNYKKDNYQEVSILTKCKSINFRVEELPEPTLMKASHWTNSFSIFGIKATIYTRTFGFNADVNVAYIFPNADEEDPDTDRAVIQAFQRPDVFNSFTSFNHCVGKVSEV